MGFESMYKFLFVAVTIVIIFGASPHAYSSTDDGMYKEDYACAHKLQEALKKNDKVAIAHLITYPIELERPLPSIKTEKDFLKSWGDFFDANTIAEVVDDEPGTIGWRGVQVGNGDIWFSKGKIYRINMRTQAFSKKLDAAKKNEDATLYPSARNYKHIRYTCDTVSHHIRIQEHKDGIYYFSWKSGAALSQKPELELKGSLENQGTGGNVIFSFKNKEYLYELNEVHTCGEDCNNYLTVSKNGQEISKQVCKFKA
jgi:hypothetical protein